MVPMKMAYKDTSDTSWRDIRENKLPLSPFPRIKKKTLLIPAQKIGSMITPPSWLLRRTPQNDQITHGHRTTPLFTSNWRYLPSVSLQKCTFDIIENQPIFNEKTKPSPYLRCQNPCDGSSCIFSGGAHKRTPFCFELAQGRIIKLSNSFPNRSQKDSSIGRRDLSEMSVASAQPRP